jgi:hypothetical protein
VQSAESQETFRRKTSPPFQAKKQAEKHRGDKPLRNVGRLSMDYTMLQYSSKCLKRFQTATLEPRALEVYPKEHRVINSDYISTVSL